MATNKTGCKHDGLRENRAKDQEALDAVFVADADTGILIVLF